MSLDPSSVQLPDQSIVGGDWAWPNRKHSDAMLMVRQVQCERRAATLRPTRIEFRDEQIDFHGTPKLAGNDGTSDSHTSAAMGRRTAPPTALPKATPPIANQVPKATGRDRTTDLANPLAPTHSL
jgi:hypothetical protein